MTEGNCFPRAFEVMGELLDIGMEVKLVHGIITGQGPIEGELIWHAWTEHRVPGPKAKGLASLGAWVAVDRSNGRDIVLERTEFRRLARVRQVWTYTPERAVGWVRQTGQFGPWQENDETRRLVR